MRDHDDVHSTTRGDSENVKPGVQAHIDTSICIGSGSCVRLARGAFTFDDEHQVAVVADPSSVDEDRLERAERSCPTGAVFVERS